MSSTWRPGFIYHWQSYYIHQFRTVQQSKPLVAAGLVELHFTHGQSDITPIILHLGFLPLNVLRYFREHKYISECYTIPAFWTGTGCLVEILLKFIGNFRCVLLPVHTLAQGLSVNLLTNTPYQYHNNLSQVHLLSFQQITIVQIVSIP